MQNKYLFDQSLIEGIIQSRPNRFVMYVKIRGKRRKAYCPSTGRIGSIDFNNIPCLLSEWKDKKRKTRFTVEAISLSEPSEKVKQWIGINQNRSNDYVEFFINSGQLPKLFKSIKSLNREVKLGKSRIDFFINNKTYLEVKMPLEGIPCSDHPNYRTDIPEAYHFTRVFKQVKALENRMKKGDKAIFLICHMYDAKPFHIPAPGTRNLEIVKVMKKATFRGLNHWQINLQIDEDGVNLLKYFKLRLF